MMGKPSLSLPSRIRVGTTHLIDDLIVGLIAKAFPVPSLSRWGQPAAQTKGYTHDDRWDHLAN